MILWYRYDNSCFGWKGENKSHANEANSNSPRILTLIDKDHKSNSPSLDSKYKDNKTMMNYKN
jgi:hypothetical protein